VGVHTNKPGRICTYIHTLRTHMPCTRKRRDGSNLMPRSRLRASHRLPSPRCLVRTRNQLASTTPLPDDAGGCSNIQTSTGFRSLPASATCRAACAPRTEPLLCYGRRVPGLGNVPVDSYDGRLRSRPGGVFLKSIVSQRCCLPACRRVRAAAKTTACWPGSR
jgi:hypothetical protein